MISVDIKNQVYIDHIVLTISDVKRSEFFYSKIFGLPEELSEDSIFYKIGQTKLFFCLPYGSLPDNDSFNPNRIGLEHFAIGIRNIAQLEEIEKVLNESAIKHSGIHIDAHSKKEKIWLNDPDGIRLEFFINDRG